MSPKPKSGVNEKIERLKDLICSVGDSFEKEREAAYMLWSWLPSHHFAQLAHEDYATEFMPAITDILQETAMVLGLLAYPDKQNDLDALVNYTNWMGCPCQECGHAFPNGIDCVRYVKQKFGLGNRPT